MNQLEGINEEVRSAILGRYGSLAQFASKANMPPQTVSTLLNRGVTNTNLSTFMHLCDALGCDPLELWHGHLVFSEDNLKHALVPLFGSIAAGKPIEPELADDVFPIPCELYKRHPDGFMLRIAGNSMNKVLPNGSLVLVDPQVNSMISGKIYAVMVGEQDTTVKQVILHDNGLTLQPLSNDPTHKPMLFDYSEPNLPSVQMIGMVVWECSDVA